MTPAPYFRVDLFRLKGLTRLFDVAYYFDTRESAYAYAFAVEERARVVRVQYVADHAEQTLYEAAFP